MIYKAYLLNSTETVFYDSQINQDTLEYTDIFQNEAFSFQLAFCCEYEDGEANGWGDVCEIEVEIHSESNTALNVYSIEYVPAQRIGYSTSDDWFLRKNPGIYPDCMCKSPNNRFSVPVGQWKSLWFNFNEKNENIPCGKQDITVKIYDRTRMRSICEKEVSVHVMNATLPKQKIIATNWLHYDCIAHFSKTKPFSKNFYQYAKEYINYAVQNGQNMILLPAFTPPLDTPIGEERPTVQLVGIKLCDGKYTFDFSKLKIFIEICLQCGIEYFEHNHLFTQWGAEHAPKIIVECDGKSKKLFGWQTDASGKEYRQFLHSYLTELKKFLKKNELEHRFFFHVSDEPTSKHLTSYTAASNLIKKELAGYPMGDALSEYEFYQQGLVQTPIVSTDVAHDFIGKATPLWVYYTGYQSSNHLSNRLIGMPCERGRLLGIQLYYFDIKGFLNWGFNAHHNKLARKFIHPRYSSDMGGDFVAGTSYLVYPSEHGADPSPRLMTFRDAMQDARVLQLLEQYEHRNVVLSIIKKHIPDISFHCKVTGEQILNLRKEVNLRICKAVERN